MAEQHELDVAVVGGGVSGIYAAWRLRQAAGGTRTGPLAELARGRGRRAAARRGVRVQRPDRRPALSLALPGVEDVPVELGGMRFLNTHRRVVALVEHFGLETEPLPVADPQDRHLVYLRGQYSTGADWGGRASTRPTGSTAASAPAPPASCCSRW